MKTAVLVESLPPALPDGMDVDWGNGPVAPDDHLPTSTATDSASTETTEITAVSASALPEESHTTREGLESDSEMMTVDAPGLESR